MAALVDDLCIVVHNAEGSPGVRQPERDATAALLAAIGKLEAAQAEAERERDELRASFASQAQVTVTARQAVSDVVAQRNEAERRLAVVTEAVRVALSGLNTIVGPVDARVIRLVHDNLRAALEKP